MVEANSAAWILGDGDGGTVAWIQDIGALVRGPGEAEEVEEDGLAGREGDGVDGVRVREDAADAAVEGISGEVAGGEEVDEGCVIGGGWWGGGVQKDRR